MSKTRRHPQGDYRFLPGIAPYSCGVVAEPGFEIVHVTLHRPLPYRQGFDRLLTHLDESRRPRAALCAIELRSPEPFTFDGFASFNREYAAILEGWDLFVDGVNPVARTNVAPGVIPPSEPSLYGFSYTRPCDPSEPTFVVAGAGELPEGVLDEAAIVRLGDISPDGLRAKAEFVLGLMADRLHALGRDWPDVSAVDIYTIHPLSPLMSSLLLLQIGPVAEHGVRRFFSRPPIWGIEFEMDLRGVRTELRIE